MTRVRVAGSVVALTTVAAVVTGCTGGGGRGEALPTTPVTSAPTAPATASPATRTPATTSAAARVATAVEPVVATGPSDAARVTVAHRAVVALGTVSPRPGASDDGAAIESGSAALVGRDGSGWFDARVTSGSWTVRMTCTGAGSVTAYAAAPSLLERRLDVGATATPDTRGTARTVVPCGSIVAFDTARPGRDGIELRVDSADGTPLTGVAFELTRSG